MDVKLVREAAIEATNRAFWDKDGFVPDEDSDEWEDEYRRQFALAKKRHATERPAETHEKGPDGVRRGLGVSGYVAKLSAP